MGASAWYFPSLPLGIKTTHHPEVDSIQGMAVDSL